MSGTSSIAKELRKNLHHLLCTKQGSEIEGHYIDTQTDMYCALFILCQDNKLYSYCKTF